MVGNKNVLFSSIMSCLINFMVFYANKYVPNLSPYFANPINPIAANNFSKRNCNHNKRKNKEHILNLTLNGYEPYQTNLVRVVDGWIIGNILIGGLIGLGIDAISGGMYHLNPKRIDIPLKQVEMKSSK